jgi:hypothetical protein
MGGKPFGTTYLSIGIILLFVGTSLLSSLNEHPSSTAAQTGNIRDPPPDEEWNRTYRILSDGRAEGKCIQATPDGGYIVTGYAGYGYWYDTYLLKVDNQGNELWNRSFGNQSIARYNDGNWVEVTSDNGYIIVGDNCRIYSKEGTTQPTRTEDDTLKKRRTDQQFYAFDNMYPVRSVWFNPTNPGTFHYIGYSTAGGYICAGTWADETWYVCEYYGGFYTVDSTTGDMTLIGETIQLNGLGYVDSSGIMYGCDSTNLYIIDMSSGATTLVGPMNNAGTMIDMAADSFGNAYGVDSIDHNLYSINLQTGAATIIGPTDLSFDYAGLGYDKDNDVLYLSAYVNGGGQFYTVDLNTGHATLIGPFQDYDEVEGLAIPYDGVWYHYDWRAWLIKTDANGNEEWNKTYALGQGLGQASGSCVKQTQDGGYIITGSDAGHLLLIKTDGLGNELWNRTYYGNYTIGISLALTSDGGYIVTGTNTYRLLLMKTDGNGTVEWKKEYFNNSWPGNSGNRVQQTDDGGYIICGNTFQVGTSNSDILLMKTDGNGGEQWNRTFGGTEWDWGSSVIQTTDGDFILGGTRGYLPQDMTDKFWLIRTHSDGTVVWDHFYLPSLSARCYCLQQTPDDSIIASGSIDFESGPWCVILKLKGDNQPPSSSPIEGPRWGVVNESYPFSIHTTDPEGDSLFCKWDWGDGNTSDWLGPYPSNETITMIHAWLKIGSYGFRVKLKDLYGHESIWSETQIITVGEPKYAFLYGRYGNTTTEGDFRIIDAVNLWMLRFRPLQSLHFTAGEKIPFLMNKSIAFTTQHFIIGLVDAMI